ITEQLVLFEVESTHRLGLASAEEDGRHFARATRALAFFNGLLVITTSLFTVMVFFDMGQRKQSPGESLIAIKGRDVDAHLPSAYANRTSR
ncbi:hypothetical protein, partial [Stutzerimonas kunmingensis]|uniref:hypothetical protein n=1 Tax=Stutzerimonas kunmingensis TaxID=1211807 RepID=UPI001CD07280